VTGVRVEGVSLRWLRRSEHHAGRAGRAGAAAAKVRLFEMSARGRPGATSFAEEGGTRRTGGRADGRRDTQEKTECGDSRRETAGASRACCAEKGCRCETVGRSEQLQTRLQEGDVRDSVPQWACRSSNSDARVEGRRCDCGQRRAERAARGDGLCGSEEDGSSNAPASARRSAREQCEWQRQRRELDQDG